MTNIFDSNTDKYEEKIDSYTQVFGQKHDFFVQDKISLLTEAFSKVGNLKDLNILDIGCGIGLGHDVINKLVKTLHGVDISKESLKLATQNNPDVFYKDYDGMVLPYGDNSFDCAYAICVMHHVPKEQWLAFVKEMIRVIRPGGLIAVIEHNPFNPGTQWIVNTIDLDRDAILLTSWRTCRLFSASGAIKQKVKYTLFTPFAHQFFRKLDRFFSKIPLGAQYIATGYKA